MPADGEMRGRRALFEAAGEDAPRHDGGERTAAPGRQALFSAGQRQPGTVVVECSACNARVPVSLLWLPFYLVPSLWLPARRWSRWMRCPSCRRMSWCRIGWRQSLVCQRRGRSN